MEELPLKSGFLLCFTTNPTAHHLTIQIYLELLYSKAMRRAAVWGKKGGVSSSTHLNHSSSPGSTSLLVCLRQVAKVSLLLVHCSCPESSQRNICPRALQTTPCKNSRASGPPLELESLGDTQQESSGLLKFILFFFFSSDDLNLIYLFLISMCSFVSEHTGLYQCALELVWALQQYLSTQGTKLQRTDETTHQLIFCLR